MPYSFKQLAQSFPTLVDRYLPTLAKMHNAFSALKNVDADKDITNDEKDALIKYVGTFTSTDTLVPYKWCDDCSSMVGVDHFHCPICTYPSVMGGVDEDAGIPAIAKLQDCGHCLECCRSLGHKICACGTHQNKNCRHCNLCKKCCKCKYCPNCDDLQECTCKCCYEHCTCPAAKPHPIYGKTFPAFKPNERVKFDCKRLAGVEWEYNRLATNKFLNIWMKRWFGTLHEDASCGMEAITAPCAGDYMVKTLTELGSCLDKSGARIDNRCSIHVHVDATDYNWADMVRLLKLYEKIEPILYIIGGQERTVSKYCVPIGKDFGNAIKKIDVKDAVMAAAFNSKNDRKCFGRSSQKEVPGRRADNHQYARRRGLNILPWLAGRGPQQTNKKIDKVVVLQGDTIEKIAERYNVSIASVARINSLKLGSSLKPGSTLLIRKRRVAPDTTVEFRIGSYATNVSKVLPWVKLLVRIVDWVAKATDKDVDDLPKSGARALCVISPESKTYITNALRTWKNQYPRITRLIKFNKGAYEIMPLPKPAVPARAPRF